MDRKSWWNGSWVLATTWILTALLAAPAVAQDGGADCVECKITKRKVAITKVDQVACPGVNRKLCVRQYERNKSAKCQGAGDLFNCKPVQKKLTYPSTNYPAGTCGTSNPATGTVSCPAVAAGGAGPKLKRKGWTCTGDPWNITGITLAEMYVIDIDSPDGVATLDLGVQPLLPTSIEIPSDLLKEGLERGEVVVVDDHLVVEAVLSTESVSRFRLPAQELQPESVNGNAILVSASVKAGEAELLLAVPLASLGAYESYIVDLGKLLVEAGPKPEEHLETVADEDQNPDGDVETLDPNEMNLLVEVTSDGHHLTSGAKLVGRMAKSVAIDDARVEGHR